MSSFLFLVSLIEKENETGKRYRFLNDNRKHLIKYIWTTVPWNLLFENTTTSFKSFKSLSGPWEQFLRHLCGFDIWILQISLAEFQCLSKMMCAIMQNIKTSVSCQFKTLVRKSLAGLNFDRWSISPTCENSEHKLFALHFRNKNGKFLSN